MSSLTKLFNTLVAFIRRFAPTLAAAAIAFASFLPGHVKHLIRSRGPLHDWYHLAAFAALSVLLCRTTNNPSRWLTYAAWAFLLGCSIEVAEAAYRYAELEWADIVCDGVGVLLGLLWTWRLRGHLASKTIRSRAGAEPNFLLRRFLSGVRTAGARPL